MATIDHFVTERDWSQFHSPKNLAMALSVETAELVEIFQWLSEEESFTPNPDKRDHIKEEIGDIMIYLTTLANKFNINPLEAAFKKMEINQKRISC